MVDAVGPIGLFLGKNDNAATGPLKAFCFLHDAFKRENAVLAHSANVHDHGIVGFLAVTIDGAHGIGGQVDPVAQILELVADGVLQAFVLLDDKDGAGFLLAVLAGRLAFDFPADGADPVEQLGRRLIAVLRIERHHRLDQVKQRLRAIHFISLHRRRIVETLFLHALMTVAGRGQGRAPGQRLVKHAAEEVDVAADVAALYARRPLQTGVVHRPLLLLVVHRQAE